MREGYLRPDAQDILAYIINHGSITVDEAKRMLHTTEARSRIAELRKAGYPIRDYYERGNDGKRYKRYFLEGNDDGNAS